MRSFQTQDGQTRVPKLVIPCCECGWPYEIPGEVLNDKLAEHLWKNEKRALVSCVSKPGEHPTFAVLCPNCAKRVHTPELLKKAHELLEENFGP